VRASAGEAMARLGRVLRFSSVCGEGYHLFVFQFQLNYLELLSAGAR